MSALTDRDINLQNNPDHSIAEKQSAAGEENKPQDSQQHRQVLKQKIAENNIKPGQTYISPSDAILSPASQKLADMKQRQMNRTGAKNPLTRALFGRTTSSCSSGFDDTETAGDSQ